MGKHYCICENKCIEETYSKNEIDERFFQITEDFRVMPNQMGFNFPYEIPFPAVVIAIEVGVKYNAYKYFYGVNPERFKLNDAKITRFQVQAHTEWGVLTVDETAKNIIYITGNAMSKPEVFYTDMRVRVTLMKVDSLK